ncbi:MULTISPECIES: DUF1476 domain-containing protein [unclassified Bartonella]|uniref:DUF1476 domain-containing protein n=1 Tax=unclassified Bartonella TaxID=2645622 RepID=UPI0015F8631A|nr:MULTISPECIES: DUF1476 domain-containing protein [unclassified Bartonella]UXN04242.1 DUF1476 domain-containing protein [Bartonella sp. HY406]UXN07233.1 DUF1476 domain-containing protein [Bartonella sp. HY761]
MSGMSERGEALENKFFHDADLRFKAEARRNRQLGLWAAEKLGKAGADADAYAKEVVISDLKEPGDNDVVEKVMADFKAANVAVSEDELREKMFVLLEEAVKSLT